MKIVKIEILEVALPLLRSLNTGFGSIDAKPNLIIRLTADNNLVGYGEAATLEEPIYTAETVETCKLILRNHIAPRILDHTFKDPLEFVQAYKDITGNNLAKTGIELAFWDLYAQSKNESLKSLLGGTKKQIPVGESVGIVENIQTLYDNIEQLLERGFVRIKLKIKPDWDIKPLEAIRKKWPQIDLSVDANTSYNYESHHKLLATLDKYDLTMLEQPFEYNDFLGHSKLQSKIKTPLCLDESIQSLNDAKTAIALKCCKIINIKPGRVGGLLESIAIHDYAAKNGIGVWCGGMLETGIGRSFNLALASKSNFIYPADMSPQSTFFEDDITQPSLILNSNGSIDVSDRVGLGYSVNIDKLNKYTTEHITLAV